MASLKRLSLQTGEIEMHCVFHLLNFGIDLKSRQPLLTGVLQTVETVMHCKFLLVNFRQLKKARSLLSGLDDDEIIFQTE